MAVVQRRKTTQSWSRQAPALIVSLLALVVALGGTVYAAAKINGKAVKLKSLPGNRLTPHSVAANRLRAGVLPSPQNPITGAQINELTLGPVPTAIFAETADRAQSALDSQTALNAVNAINATKVNGYSAGCLPSTQLFAGACWESSPSGVSMTAPNAAIDCAEKGGSLPDALELAAFAKEPGVNLDSGSEWSSEIISYSAGPYGVATVSPLGVIGSGVVKPEGGGDAKQFRCVTPLVK